MSKYCLILVLALFAFTASVQAEDNKMAVEPGKQYVLEVINSDYNWFDQQTVMSILDDALGLLAYQAEWGYVWGISDAGWEDGWYTPINQTTVTAAQSMLTGIKGWLQNGYSNPDVLEGVTQDLLAKGHMVHMSGSSGAANELAFDDGTSFQGGTDIFFLGRNVTWPGSPGYVHGEYGQIRVSSNTGQAYTFNFSGAETPIVLDMDGDGKLEASAGQWLPHAMKETEKLVAFDMDCDGFDDLTEWVGPNDGLLVAYNGGEMTAANLFGNEGGCYKNGYEKLSLLDTNRDGKLTADEMQTLSIWQDKNGNAQVDQGEVASVASLGITEIQVNHKNLVSSFIHNGTRKVMWDWNPCVAPVKKHRK